MNNIATVVTFSRFIFAISVAILLCFDSKTILLIAVILFILGALSDAIDGTLARKQRNPSRFGAFIDPIADKALLVGTYITLGHESFLPIWLVILVVFRDIVIVGGALIFHTVTQSLSMRPLMISKVNTVAQLLLAIGVLFIF